MSSTRAHVAVLVLQLAIPGARSLKDRRQVLVSLRDRIKARFDVSCHEISADDLHARGALIVTCGGNDPQVLAQLVDRIRSFAAAHGGSVLTDAPSEVRPWPDALANDRQEWEHG